MVTPLMEAEATAIDTTLKNLIITPRPEERMLETSLLAIIVTSENYGRLTTFYDGDYVIKASEFSKLSLRNDEDPNYDISGLKAFICRIDKITTLNGDPIEYCYTDPNGKSITKRADFLRSNFYNLSSIGDYNPTSSAITYNAEIVSIRARDKVNSEYKAQVLARRRALYSLGISEVRILISNKYNYEPLFQFPGDDFLHFNEKASDVEFRVLKDVLKDTEEFDGARLVPNDILVMHYGNSNTPYKLLRFVGYPDRESPDPLRRLYRTVEVRKDESGLSSHVFEYGTVLFEAQIYSRNARVRIFKTNKDFVEFYNELSEVKNASSDQIKALLCTKAGITIKELEEAKK